MTDNDLEELDKKIRSAMGEDDELSPEELKQKQNQSEKEAGLQAGMEFAASIMLPSFIGYKLDQYFHSAPLCFIVLFLLGVGAGFASLFKMQRKINGTIGYYELHRQEKTANRERTSEKLAERTVMKVPEQDNNKSDQDQSE